ncbi:MAG: response regulator [Alphaproteobacteria bacterium]|nr:response regulator [Alphaproteobacteria bacterium]
MASKPHNILDLSDLAFLLVEDNPNMRSLIKEFLRCFGGRKFLEAEEGADGLGLLEHKAVDIVITNWEMRPIDGLELVRLIRRQPVAEKRSVPVIMASGYSTPSNVRLARDQGVTEFLTKPISARELYKRIENVILRPRPFIRAKNYIGPCRHRHDDTVYEGPKRRNMDDDLFSATAS